MSKHPEALKRRAECLQTEADAPHPTPSLICASSHLRTESHNNTTRVTLNAQLDRDTKRRVQVLEKHCEPSATRRALNSLCSKTAAVALETLQPQTAASTHG